MSVVLSDFLNQPKEAKDHLALPGLPKCDGAIRAWGNMMAPEIKAGDLIVYKRVKDLRDGIWFGQIYLLSVDREGEEYIMVQYVEESEQEQYVRLVSGNPGKFRPQEVRLDSIKAAAMVKASIRYRAI